MSILQSTPVRIAAGIILVGALGTTVWWAQTQGTRSERPEMLQSSKIGLALEMYSDDTGGFDSPHGRTTDSSATQSISSDEQESTLQEKRQAIIIPQFQYEDTAIIHPRSGPVPSRTDTEPPVFLPSSKMLIFISAREVRPSDTTPDSATEPAN